LNDILNGVIEIILRYKQKEKNSLNAGNSLSVPKVINLCDYIKKSVSNPNRNLSKTKVIISLKFYQIRFNFFF
jgi:hypothetical protein